MNKYTEEQLEAAFEFCRIVNERGGYRINGYEGHRPLPNLHRLINNPKDYTHLPKPPEKVMMQMWRNAGGYEVAHPAKTLVGHKTKIGEPFEFVFPEEVK